MSKNRDTFTRFLKTKKHLDSHEGEFALDWLNDHNNGKPRGAFGWKALKSYLQGCDACDSCMDVAESLFSEWAKIAENEKKSDLSDLSVKGV